jgi:hypothetical protein
MAKGSTAKVEVEDNYPEEEGALGGLNFNVEDEYKADPLVPNGTYHGVVTKVSFVPATCSIIWSICLHDNGGVLSDDETPIDGAYVMYVNSLPRPGDEDLMTPSGKSTKRQWKINALSEFSKILDIDMSTPPVILQALEEGIWIGIEVDVDVAIEEYKGKFNSKVKLGGIRKSLLY